MPDTPLTPLDIPVRGMSCASCVGRVEKAIAAVPGVETASVNLAAERAHVEVAGQDQTRAVVEAIRRAGYETLERTVKLKVEGMTCASCVGRVERALRAVPGVLSAEVNLATERASVRLLEGAADAAALAQAVAQAGYGASTAGEATPDLADREREAREAEISSLKRAVALAASATAPVFFVEMARHFIPGGHHLLATTVGEQPWRSFPSRSQAWSSSARAGGSFARACRTS